MFVKLVIHEMKYQIKSITFIIFCTFVLLFYVTQFIGDMDRIDTPSHPIDHMQTGDMDMVYNDSNSESHVTLEEQKKTLTSLLGRDLENHNTPLFDDMGRIELKPLTDGQLTLLEQLNITLQDTTFTEALYGDMLEQLQQNFGEHTIYTQDRVKRYGVKVKNYLFNKQEADAIKKYEKVTGAYARLFADYIGIAVGFFSIFIAGFALVKDKRYKAAEMIYTKPVSSIQYVLSKYVGNVVLMLAVVLIIAAYTTYTFHIEYDQINYVAFFQYTLTWILPTIMVVTSIGYLIQIIAGNGIVPIIAIFAYWFYSMPFTRQQYHITRYIIRYNKVTTLAKYQEVASAITTNRLFITGASLIILIIALWLFEKKRGHICG